MKFDDVNDDRKNKISLKYFSFMLPLYANYIILLYDVEDMLLKDRKYGCCFFLFPFNIL